MHLPTAAPLLLGWKSAQTQDTQPQEGSPCPQHSGFTKHPNTYRFLFPWCPSNFFAFFILFLFSLSSCFVFLSSFFCSLLYFVYKKIISINQKYPYIQKVQPTPLAQWECVHFPLFINLRCTALKSNTLKSSLFK